MTLTPLYETDRAVLYCADALDVLPTIPAGTVDLFLTDPPYGVGFRSNARIATPKFDAIAGDDSTDVGEAVVATAIRCLKPSRHLYVFGPFREALEAIPNVSEPAELIWDKGTMGMGDLTRIYGPSYEHIYFATRAAPSAQTKGVGRLAARLRRGSILRVNRRAATKYRHPTEKPVELLRALIECSSLPGETVLDPFVGCGSTMVAAILSGRRAIGIELTEEYADTTAKRLAEAEAIADLIEAA